MPHGKLFYDANRVFAQPVQLAELFMSLKFT